MQWDNISTGSPARQRCRRFDPRSGVCFSGGVNVRVYGLCMACVCGGAAGSIPRSGVCFSGGVNVCVYGLCMGFGVHGLCMGFGVHTALRVQAVLEDWSKHSP